MCCMSYFVLPKLLLSHLEVIFADLLPLLEERQRILLLSKACNFVVLIVSGLLYLMMLYHFIFPPCAFPKTPFKVECREFPFFRKYLL